MDFQWKPKKKKKKGVKSLMQKLNNQLSTLHQHETSL